MLVDHHCHLDFDTFDGVVEQDLYSTTTHLFDKGGADVVVGVGEVRAPAGEEAGTLLQVATQHRLFVRVG